MVLVLNHILYLILQLRIQKRPDILKLVNFLNFAVGIDFEEEGQWHFELMIDQIIDFICNQRASVLRFLIINH